MYLQNKVYQKYSASIQTHDLKHEIGNEDIKAVTEKYFEIRLLRYGQYFTSTIVVKTTVGLRPKCKQNIIISRPIYI